jgi:3-oxoadipate enol-lactonase
MDRHAMARLILLTGFSPEFLSGLGPEAISQAAEEIAANNNWEGMARQVELDLTIDVSAHARLIAKPTLVIGCVHDQMVPVSHARELASFIPGARYEELATGHLAPLEKPQELLELVLGFLAHDLI